MPQPYPTPNFNTTTGLFEYVNLVTSNWAVTLILMAACIVIFALLKERRYSTSYSLLVSFFMTFVFSTFFWAIGLIAGKIMVLFLLFSILSAIYNMFDTD